MKTLLEFKKDILNKFGMTPTISFWYRFIYQQYKKETITYEVALKKVSDMQLYSGV
jgi:flagellar biosynthesis protein FliP